MCLCGNVCKRRVFCRLVTLWSKAPQQHHKWIQRESNPQPEPLFVDGQLPEEVRSWRETFSDETTRLDSSAFFVTNTRDASCWITWPRTGRNHQKNHRLFQRNKSHVTHCYATRTSEGFTRCPVVLLCRVVAAVASDDKLPLQVGHRSRDHLESQHLDFHKEKAENIWNSSVFPPVQESDA